MRAGGEVVEGVHDAIVDTATWDKAQERLATVKRQRPKRKSDRLLAGLLRCARCGRVMMPTHTSKRNRRYTYYLCATAEKKGAKACPGARVAAGDIETAVLDQIRQIGENPALARETACEAKERLTAERDETRARVRALAQQRADLERERQGVIDRLDRNGTDPRPLHEVLGEITAKLARVETEEREAEEQIQALGATAILDDSVAEALRTFGPVWSELFPKEQAKIAHALVESVTYDPDGDEVEIDFRPAAVALIGEKNR